MAKIKFEVAEEGGVPVIRQNIYDDKNNLVTSTPQDLGVVEQLGEKKVLTEYVKAVADKVRVATDKDFAALTTEEAIAVAQDLANAANLLSTYANRVLTQRTDTA